MVHACSPAFRIETHFALEVASKASARIVWLLSLAKVGSAKSQQMQATLRKVDPRIPRVPWP